MEIKTGAEILSEYRNQEQNLSTFKALEELIDEELEKAKSFPLDKPVKPATCERCKELEELLSKFKYDQDAYLNPHYCFGYLYSEYKQQKPRFEKILGVATHSYMIEQQVNTLLTILEGKLPSKLSV